MKLPRDFIESVREKCPLEQIAARYTRLKRQGKEFCGLSPFNPERTPSFYVIPAKRMFHCFSSGRSGSCFDLVIQVEGVTFIQAVADCAAVAGLPMPLDWLSGAKGDHPIRIPSDAARDARIASERASREQQNRIEANKLRGIAYDIWTNATPIGPTTPAYRYLLNRGIEFAAGFRTLRAVGRLSHRDPRSDRVTHWPALVAAVQAPDDGRFLAIWRIYVTEEGKKAPVDKPKLGLGSYTLFGGSVWLGEPGPVANPCEGIESGCGIYGILGQKQGVQAALSTSGLVNFRLPHGSQRALIWPDGDGIRVKRRPDGSEQWSDSPGHRAADLLRERLTVDGIKATIQPTPRNGSDGNDLWNATKGEIECL